MPCGTRGLVRAVVGGFRSISIWGRAEARLGIGCLSWPRGHEPGAAAETRPAVSGPGTRRVAGLWASGRRGLAGSAQLIAKIVRGCGSGVRVGGLHCGLGVWLGSRMFLRGFSCGSHLPEYMSIMIQTSCLQLRL